MRTALLAALLLAAAPAQADRVAHQSSFCTFPGVCQITLPQTDLTVAHLEINQVLQDWGNHIPLVLGKPIAVRVSVEAAGDRGPNSDGSWTVDGATLDVYHGATHVGTLASTNSSVRVQPGFVDPQSYRADASRTFNFLIPSLWQYADGIQIVVNVNSLLHTREPNYANDSASMALSLTRTQVPQVVGLSFSSPSHPYSRSDHIASYAAQLREVARLWPVWQLYFVDCCGEQQYWGTKRPDVNPGPTPTDVYFPGAWDVITAADQARRTTLAGQFKNDFWYVLQPWYTGLNGTTLPSGYTYPAYALTASTGQDTTGIAEGWVMAHELAHQLSQLHTGGDVNTFVDPDCCPDGRINALHASTFGLDIETMTVLPPVLSDGSRNVHDFMAYYQALELPSDYTYERLFRLLTQPLAAVHTRAAPAPELFVTGRISDAGAQLDPAFELPDAPAQPTAQSGAYTLELRAADGHALASSRFDPASSDPEPGAPLAFSQALPAAPDAATLVLRRDQAVLATIARSAHAPTVQILTPTPGAHWEGAKTVSWSATDEDGDPLRYMVQYSSDGGRTWLTVASGLDATSLPIDAVALAGSGDCRVRVIASDGLNSTAAVSERFGVNPHAPRVRIISARPARGGRQLELLAGVQDPDQGRLDGRAVVWRSNRGGRLGTGSSLLTGQLRPGRHVVTVTATDRTGSRGRARVTVTLHAPKEPGPPRAVRVRVRHGTAAISWRRARGPVLRYVVQTARTRIFTTVASLPPGRRAVRLKAPRARARWRVGACRLDACAFSRSRR